MFFLRLIYYMFLTSPHQDQPLPASCYCLHKETHYSTPIHIHTLQQNQQQEQQQQAAAAAAAAHLCLLSAHGGMCAAVNPHGPCTAATLSMARRPYSVVSQPSLKPRCLLLCYPCACPNDCTKHLCRPEWLKASVAHVKCTLWAACPPWLPLRPFS